MEQNELKKLLEAFLFVSSSPVQAARIKTLFGVDEKAVETAFEELKIKYASDDTALRVIKVAEGYRLSTSPEVAPYVRKFFKDQRPRLSRASLETLSVIAYKQPVTRSDVESIRGVNVEGPLGTLLERGLTRIAGRKDAPGRPILYGTTRLFLEHFGLNTLRDLPLLNEFKEEDLTEEEKAKAGGLREANNEPSQTS
ncbi:MAG: SMC-Scp complex subunit ScpB [Candidatus Omnitrophota bacterium]